MFDTTISVSSHLKGWLATVQQLNGTPAKMNEFIAGRARSVTHDWLVEQSQARHKTATKCLACFFLSAWRRMRDAHLLGTARTVIATAQSVLTAHSAEAAECGITAASIAACTQEADDYEAVISAPQQAIAGRKGLTVQMRERFNAVEALFTSMDNLIDQFADQNFVAGYKAARVVRDLGHGPGGTPPSPPTPPPNP